MKRRILLINGHPDASAERLAAALCAAYAEGAAGAGNELRRLDLGKADVGLLRSASDFEGPPASPDMNRAQEDILWADHLVIVFPLWLGGPPALVKAFLEQTFRYGFALPKPGGGGALKGLLGGRSARLIVTMGMPALIYRTVFGAFGVRAVERSILRLCGFRPVRRTLIGGVGGLGRKAIEHQLARVRSLGAGAC